VWDQKIGATNMGLYKYNTKEQWTVPHALSTESTGNQSDQETKTNQMNRERWRES